MVTEVFSVLVHVRPSAFAFSCVLLLLHQEMGSIKRRWCMTVNSYGFGSLLTYLPIYSQLNVEDG